MWLHAHVALGLTATVTALSPTTTIPKWCGKPYMPGHSDCPPGGALNPPIPSPSPSLHIQLQSRHTIYDSSELHGQFIVEASISYTHGEPLNIPDLVSQTGTGLPSQKVDFEVKINDVSRLLVSDSIYLSSGAQLYSFDFDDLEPRLQPYHVALDARFVHSKRYTITAELYYLPAKYSGSTVKVDNLKGGLLVANHDTNWIFHPFLPFGFYTSCSGYLNHSLANIVAYKDLGFNVINPVCAFTDGDIGYVFDWLDETNVWYQYDMRGSYQNLTSVAEQVPLIRDRTAFLSWYTGDEPDAWSHAFNSTQLAYDFLRKQDPYHPTGLVLNCDNYYFKEHSAGADYLMEDAYPIGIDPIYSHLWNTTCNTTCGDCGCDNCKGDLTDVSNRLDSYLEYQQWLGRPRKPLWAVIQAFHGEYWSRSPTVLETWAMILLSFNHGAKAIMSWVFPTSSDLSEAHAAFARVVAVPPVSTFLLHAEPVSVNVKHNEMLDVSYWSDGQQFMVGIVNLDRLNGHQQIEIQLPFAARKIESQPWGDVPWALVDNTQGCTLRSTHGLDGLATSIVILSKRNGSDRPGMLRYFN